MSARAIDQKHTQKIVSEVYLATSVCRKNTGRILKAMNSLSQILKQKYFNCKLTYDRFCIQLFLLFFVKRYRYSFCVLRVVKRRLTKAAMETSNGFQANSTKY